MSTKIYYAYRLKVDNLLEFSNFIENFRREATDIFNQEYNKVLARMLIFYQDDQLRAEYFCRDGDWNSDKNTLGSYQTILDKIEEEYRKLKKLGAQRNPWYDFECELVIFFDKDYAYFIIFADKKEYNNLLESLTGVEYYGYWDNTDPPDNVSDQEWEERSEKWNSLLPEQGVPSRSGLIFELVGSYLPLMSYDDLDKSFFPSYDERIDEAFRKEKLSSYPDRFKNVTLPNEKLEMKKWAESDEAQGIFQVKRLAILKFLPKEYKKEDFFNYYR